MTVRIAVRLDDGLAEEDARGQPYTDEQEAELMAARRRRAIAALDEP